MRIIEVNNTVNINKLKEIGFALDDNKYRYEKPLNNGDFKIIITLSDKLVVKVIDIKTDSEYLPLDITSFNGEFVGKLRKEVDDIVNDILNKCFDNIVFKSSQTIEIIKYITDKFKDDIEYLWDKYPNNGIFRNKNNNKWYAAILTTDEGKFNGDKNKIIEIIDLKNNENIVDNINVFEGYHMNKKSWITIKLDNSVNTNYIKDLIDISYDIVNKK
ncbi:MAG: MmcQ/YjbR family DNA-binding protein [Bacilli bacterium]|nr:MmcQ/YjbR family DNA-binding protein [Bacilli bacterium]